MRHHTPALLAVLDERTAQEAKWGEQNHDPFTYLTILMEEVGELSQAALHCRFGGPAAVKLREEAVQVAAVALAIVECLDRGKWSFRSDVDQHGLPLSERGKALRDMAQSLAGIAEKGQEPTSKAEQKEAQLAAYTDRHTKLPDMKCGDLSCPCQDIQ